MMVTSAPNDFQTDANSEPMTPPPSTITDLGTQSRLEGLVGRDDPAA